MDEHIERVQSIIDSMPSGKKELRVLEAGCGSCSHIQLGRRSFVVGIDISKEQLGRNSTLNEKIKGDIQ